MTMAMTTGLVGTCTPQAETEMSRRYLMMLQKWIPIGLGYFEDWPDRPNCGHFLGGCTHYGIDSSPPVAALVSACASPEYDEHITGVSKDELRRIAMKAIRYLCFTHDTGPEDCVRPAGKLAVPSLHGTKWGERGTKFFLESQCGYTISKLVPAALSLRPWMDDETWMMLANVCMDYLERFGDMAPRDGVYNDTQMEENAWTSLGLAASCLFLSGHDKAGRWEENAKKWMFSACAAPQDRRNQIEIEKGVTAAQLTGTTFTTLPDYMAENHGVVHPGYTASGIASTGHLGILYRLFGKTEPPHAYWNRRQIYETIKPLTDGIGAPHAVQGMDWPYLHNLGIPDLGLDYVLHGVAHLFLKDPDAGHLERLSLDVAERVQNGNDGHLVDADVAAKCQEYGAPFVLRERAIAGPAAMYLMHRFMDSEAPEPTAAEDVETRLQGVKVFPHSGFAFHRHVRGQTSLAWRNQIMALPLTREGIHTVGPARGTLLANVVVRNNPASQRLVSIRLNEGDDGFAAAMVNDLAQASIRQKVMFASLPDGKVLCSETLTALKDCTVEHVHQGFLEIMNESFPAIEGNCDGQRSLYHAGGPEVFKGFVSATPDEDTAFELTHPGWVNVDDRIGIVFQGSEKTVYRNRHHFKNFLAVANSLCLSVQDEERKHDAGATVGDLAFLFCPEQPHGETPGQKLTRAEASDNAICLITGGHLCAANFASERTVCFFELEHAELVPVFEGTTRIGTSAVVYILGLEAREAVFLKETMSVSADSAITIVSLAGGGSYVTNEGEREAHVRIVRGGQETQLGIPAGGNVVV
jgi:hypothetical protein